MSHHQTYRVSVALAKVTIAYAGQEPVVLEIPDGAGHDKALDMALDHLAAQGRKTLYYGPAPRPEFIPHSTIRTEHYIVTTVPAKPAIAAEDDSPSAPLPPAESAEDLV